MSDARLSSDEADCVLALAKHFEAGEEICNDPEAFRLELGLSEEALVRVLRGVEAVNLVTNLLIHRENPDSGTYKIYFEIDRNVIQAARQIEASRAEKPKPKDLVEDVKATARSHPILAWVFIVFLILTAIATFANQTTGFLKNVGVIK